MATKMTTITAASGVVGQLMPAAMGRTGARLENPFAVPILLCTDPTFTAPAQRVGATDTPNKPVEYIFDMPPTEEWFYKVAASGDFVVTVW